MQPLRVFIGFDRAEEVAAHVMVASIHRHSSKPVSVTFIESRQLGEFYRRERDPRQSNEFTFTRFLVPYLCGYTGGPALFVDCDMIVTADVAELWRYAHDKYAVSCVHHEYVPKDSIKYLNTKQYAYPKKNWASVMLFNPAHEACKMLTPDFIQSAPPEELLRFEWCAPGEVGELPPHWNHLVDEENQVPVEQAKLIHFTNGGPYFRGYRNVPAASKWWAEYAEMLHCRQATEQTA